MRTGFGRLQSRYGCRCAPAVEKIFTQSPLWKAAGSMSEWRDEINRKALARLDKALPEVFPPPSRGRGRHRADGRSLIGDSTLGPATLDRGAAR
jgi:hypothetical protein